MRNIRQGDVIKLEGRIFTAVYDNTDKCARCDIFKTPVLCPSSVMSDYTYVVNCDVDDIVFIENKS